MAYGKRSSSSTFLITALKDFLPFGEEREHFNSWLFSNKTILIHELLAEGGNLSKNWYETHKNDIQKNLWDDIYIPRRFFGKYIKEKLEALIDETTKSSSIQIHYIKNKVVEVVKSPDSNYEIKLNHSLEEITTRRLVLSVGIPRRKSLLSLIHI